MHKTKSLRRQACAVGVIVAALLVSTAALVAPAGAATSGVTIAASVNPSVAGQRVTLRIAVTDGTLPASGISGTATISDGSTLLGTAAVTLGKASFATNALGAGDHAITAAFTSISGGTTVVSTPLVQTVTAARTSLTLATSRATANYGDPGNITATVKAIAPGAGVPTGSVDFSVDGGWYISEPVNAAGKATLPLADLYPSFYPGTYAIAATYTGDVNYGPSTSATPLSQTIVGISQPPITTLALSSTGLPVFTPRSFTLSSVSPIGCNVTITNTTPTAQALVYGTPGSWKRLPGGTIPAGASRGVGVGIGNYTGYFSTMANTNNYVAIRCR